MNVDKLDKYYQKRLSKIKFPVIVKFDDHHQEFMHYAEDADELGDVFLHVLENRMDSYFYFDEDAELAKDEDEDDLTLEQIEKLPKQYREDAMRKYKEKQEESSSANENNKIYAKAKKAIKENDAGAAWECIEAHRQCADENFDIISIESLRV